MTNHRSGWHKQVAQRRRLRHPLSCMVARPMSVSRSISRTEQFAFTGHAELHCTGPMVPDSHAIRDHRSILSRSIIPSFLCHLFFQAKSQRVVQSRRRTSSTMQPVIRQDSDAPQTHRQVFTSLALFQAVSSPTSTRKPSAIPKLQVAFAVACLDLLQRSHGKRITVLSAGLLYEHDNRQRSHQRRHARKHQRSLDVARCRNHDAGKSGPKSVRCKKSCSRRQRPCLAFREYSARPASSP